MRLSRLIYHIAPFLANGKGSGSEVAIRRRDSSLIRAVVFTFSREDHQLLESLEARGDFVFVQTWAEVLGVAKTYKTGIVLIDRNVLGTDWREAISSLLQPAQRCCVVLIIPSTSGRFREEFLSAGGYGVLASPLHEGEVLRIVQGAWAFWTHCIVPAYRYSSSD